MKRRGFTLLELMTVVALVGLMASMSLYGLQQLTLNTRRTSAIRDVYMLVQQARSEARARNQPVRLQVTPGANGLDEVRWGRMPCADPWGRTCPTSACVNAAACGTGGCTCEATSLPVSLPQGVTMSNVTGLCFVGSTSVPRGPACDAATPARTALRFDLEGQTAPFLIVLEPLAGTPRLIDCGRAPKDPTCP